MNDSDIRKFLEGYQEARRTRALKAHPTFMARVLASYSDVTDAGEAAYLFVRAMTSRPVCKACSGPVSWFGNRFAETCSKRCSNQLGGSAGKMRESMQKKYGTTEAAHLPGIAEKRRATMIAKHGSAVSENHVSRKPSTWEKLNKKGRETLRERYGVSNPGQLADHSTKVRDTLESKHGVSHPFLIPATAKLIAERRHKRIAALLPAGGEVISIDVPKTSNGEANFRYALRCKCGTEEILPSETFKFRMREAGNFCSTCTGLTTARSLKELALVAEIRKIYDGKIIENDRTIIRPYELDIVLPEKKLAIEFAGLFWHSEQRVGMNYHRDKLSRCTGAGYRLITIFEDEWDKQQAIVLARLTHILNLGGGGRIYARSCTVEAIDAATARTFIDSHHIQGYTPATIKLGLFQDAALVAVMTFSRPNIAKGHRGAESTHWELSRFAVTGSVIGAASKLFQHFLRTYAPTKVITYSDLRWNSGNVYAQMGFKAQGITTPGYYYFKGAERFHRFQFRKTEAENLTGETERDLRLKQGYRRIYDCGHSSWIWMP